MARQDRHELLAAIAGQQAAVIGKDLPDCRGQVLQTFIARLVAVGVVEVLEMIDIDHQQRQVRPFPSCGAEAFLKDQVELAAVGKPGEGIGVSLGCQCLICDPQQPVFRRDLLKETCGDFLRLELT
ncbi:MAG: hypothetical protein RIC18_16500 [Hoeflea sp.]